MQSKKFTPTVNPETFLNSGSKQFTAQQASIYKIVFFNQQNDLEYAQYLLSNLNVQPVFTPDSKFPVQITTPTPRFVFKAGGPL